MASFASRSAEMLTLLSSSTYGWQAFNSAKWVHRMHRGTFTICFLNTFHSSISHVYPKKRIQTNFEALSCNLKWQQQTSNIVNVCLQCTHRGCLHFQMISWRTWFRKVIGITMLNVMKSAVSIIHPTYINNVSLQSNNQLQTLDVLLILTIFHPPAFLYPHWRMRSSK